MERDGRQESPSRIVLTKNWHQSCFAAHSFVRPRQSHSSVPTADFSRRRVERQSRTALLQRRRRLVLDGREHDGMLRRIGAERDRATWRTLPRALHQQKNHRVHFVSGVSFYTLQSRLLDGVHLLIDDEETLHLTPKLCHCVGRQRNPLGG